MKRKYWKLFELWCVPFGKNVFRVKRRLKFWVEFLGYLPSRCVYSAGETPDTPQEQREIKQKKNFSCMKPFASYSRRFKLNFKRKKTDFLKNLHWCCPLKIVLSCICSALESTNIFVQLSSDITFHTIECGVTTCPGYRESCHRWPSFMKWSLRTIVLILKEIRYCWIVARGSLKTLAYHSLPKYWIRKIQKSWNKMCDN